MGGTVCDVERPSPRWYDTMWHGMKKTSRFVLSRHAGGVYGLNKNLQYCSVFTGWELGFVTVRTDVVSPVSATAAEWRRKRARCHAVRSWQTARQNAVSYLSVFLTTHIAATRYHFIAVSKVELRWKKFLFRIFGIPVAWIFCLLLLDITCRQMIEACAILQRTVNVWLEMFTCLC